MEKLKKTKNLIHVLLAILIRESQERNLQNVLNVVDINNLGTKLVGIVKVINLDEIRLNQSDIDVNMNEVSLYYYENSGLRIRVRMSIKLLLEKDLIFDGFTVIPIYSIQGHGNGDTIQICVSEKCLIQKLGKKYVDFSFVVPMHSFINIEQIISDEEPDEIYWEFPINCYFFDDENNIYTYESRGLELRYRMAISDWIKQTDKAKEYDYQYININEINSEISEIIENTNNLIDKNNSASIINRTFTEILKDIDEKRHYKCDFLMNSNLNKSLSKKIIEVIRNSNKFLYVMGSIDGTVLDELLLLVKKGVEVKIIMRPIGSATPGALRKAYPKVKKVINKENIKLNENLHSRLVYNGAEAVIGSSDLTSSSFSTNYESGIYTNNEDVFKSISHYFKDVWDDPDSKIPKS